MSVLSSLTVVLTVEIRLLLLYGDLFYCLYIQCINYENDLTNEYNFNNARHIIFMARRAIPMIAFPRVRCMFIYIYSCVTYASMRCIRS